MQPLPAIDGSFALGGEAKPTFSMELRLHFDCRHAGPEDWKVHCPSVPGVSTFGVTQDAALRSAATVALRAIAELVTKGDPHWAHFKEARRAAVIARYVGQGSPAASAGDSASDTQ